MLKNTLVFLAASIPFLGYSDDTSECCEPCPHLPPNPIESCQYPVGLFHPGQYFLGNCCLDLSVGAEFIYWETNLMAVCQIGTKIVNKPNGNVVTTELFHNQGYRPGFKVSLGLVLPAYDNWALDIEYTWLHRTTTRRFTADVAAGEVLAPKFLPQFAPSFSSNLRSDVRFNLDFLQAVVGRSIYTGMGVIVKPSVGLKGWHGLYQQNLRLDTLGPLRDGTQFTKFGMWGIGPYAYLLVKSLFPWGIYMTGKVGIWPLYTSSYKYRTATNYPVTVPPNLFPGFQNVERDGKKYGQTSAFFDGGVRLGWGTYFCCESYHVDISVGYDAMHTILRDVILPMGVGIGDFYYQGLTVRAQLDF